MNKEKYFGYFDVGTGIPATLFLDVDAQGKVYAVESVEPSKYSERLLRKFRGYLGMSIDDIKTFADTISIVLVAINDWPVTS